MNASEIMFFLNIVQSILHWLSGARGIPREHAIALLNKANAEGRDVTSDEVQAELDLLQSELDDTADMIDGDDQ